MEATPVQLRNEMLELEETTYPEVSTSVQRIGVHPLLGNEPRVHHSRG